MSLARQLKRSIARALLPEAELERARKIEFHDQGHGLDVLGFEPESFAVALGLSWRSYERYFRVQSHGSEHLPREGAAILAANHSGLLPIDAVMITVDVFRHTDPPRVARSIGDLFIPFMPWLGTAFSRVGTVSGTASNVSHLLEGGELVLVFPEGTPGIGKGFGKRYELQDWRVGHVELAMRHRVPVVPVAVVGAEEAWPQIARLDGFHWFGAPFLPIPATPLPLPVRIHVLYGEPLWLHQRFSPSDAEDPATARAAADLVKGRVKELIELGLSRRKGLFR